MTDREWERFFALLHVVVGLPEKTWQEKMEAVKRAAAANDAEGDLDEFVSWDW